VNHLPESRVREIRTHGSEGGEAGPTVSSYPYLSEQARPSPLPAKRAGFTTKERGKKGSSPPRGEAD